MKKVLVLATVALIALVFASCSPAKKENFQKLENDLSVMEFVLSLDSVKELKTQILYLNEEGTVCLIGVKQGVKKFFLFVHADAVGKPAKVFKITSYHIARKISLEFEVGKKHVVMETSTFKLVTLNRNNVCLSVPGNPNPLCFTLDAIK